MNYRLFILIAIQLSVSALAYAGDTVMMSSSGGVYSEVNVVLTSNASTVWLSTSSVDHGPVWVTYSPSSGVSKTSDSGSGSPSETAYFSFNSTTVGKHNTIKVTVSHTAPNGATCSNNTSTTFNVFIPKITTTTEATLPTNLTRTTLGVGELDDITIQPTDIGTVNWTVSGGAGTVSPASGTSTTFTADPTPASDTVIATFGGGTSVSVPFTIIAPSTEYIWGFNNAGDIATADNLNVDTYAYWYVGPETVNFSHVQIVEATCNATLTGYFTLRFPGGIAHTPGPPLPVTNTLVPGKGWQCSGTDHISTGDNPPEGIPSEYSAGTFDWPIPWSYIVGTTTTSLDTIHQQENMTMNVGQATLTLSKLEDVDSVTQP